MVTLLLIVIGLKVLDGLLVTALLFQVALLELLFLKAMFLH